MDKAKTIVSFWVEPEDEGSEGQVMAFFPEVEYFRHRSSTKQCYAHIGQHSACELGYLERCKPATPEEYKDLKAELEREFGYSLNVIEAKKATYYKRTRFML